MNPLNGKDTVINFIDEVNKQRSLDSAYSNINNDPVIKARRLNETKQQGVDTCMNHILSKICINAIPEVNGRVADTPDLDKFVKLLYSQALLIEGFPIENPVEFSNMMCELMIKSAKY